MKLIIAGSRHLGAGIGPDTIDRFLKIWGLNPETIVSGAARGIDQCGESYAERENKQLVKFPADWDKHGNRAGFLRNKQMAEYGDALLLIWDGLSPGSQMMKRLMKEAHKPIYEIILKSQNTT